MKIRKEFKDDMKIVFLTFLALTVICCFWYSWCMFLIDTLGLPCLKSRFEEQGIFEVIVSGTFYTAIFYIIIMIFVVIHKILYTIINYIFE